MAKDKQVIIPLGFDYDPSVIDQFVKDMNDAKNSAKETAEGVSNISQALDALKGIIGGVVTAITGVVGVGQIVENQELPKRFRHQFEGVIDEAERTKLRLAKTLGFSKNDVARMLLQISEGLANVGVSDKTRLNIAETIVTAASDFAAKTGRQENIEEIIGILRNFVEGGSIDELAKLQKRWGRPAQLRLDEARLRSLSENRDALSTQLRAGFLRDFGAQFAGETQKSGGIALNLRKTQGNLENVIDAWARELIPTTEMLTK